LNKIIFLLSLVLISSSHLYAEDKLRIAVLDFTASNLPDVYAATSRDNIEVSLYKTGKFELLERNRVQLAIKEQNLPADCRSDECVSKIGKLLSATHVLTGSITQIKKCTVTVRLIDVSQGKIVYADEESVDKKENINTALANLSKRIQSKIQTLTPAQVSNNSREIAISASAGYVNPQGVLSNLEKSGYSIGLSAQYNKVYKDFYLGSTLEFISLSGKGSVSKVNIIPLTLDVGYNSPIYNRFFITPALSCGYALNHTTKDKTTNSLEPIFLFSLSPSYGLTEKVYIKVDPEYSCIIERSGLIRYFSIIGSLQYIY